MTITATYSAVPKKLTVTGEDNAENITISRNVAGAILVNGGAVPVAGGSPAVANTDVIEVRGLGLNDTIILNEASGILPSADLYGGNGLDLLTGGSNNDRLYGEAESDHLIGGAGNDYLVGGSGGDLMRGGAGGDIYYVDDDGDVVDEIPPFVTWNFGGVITFTNAPQGTELETLPPVGRQFTGSVTFTTTPAGLVSTDGTHAEWNSSTILSFDLDDNSRWNGMYLPNTGGTVTIDNNAALDQIFFQTTQGEFFVRLTFQQHAVNPGALSSVFPPYKAPALSLFDVATFNIQDRDLNGGPPGAQSTGNITSLTDTADQGIDTVFSSISFNLSDATRAKGSIEDLLLLGTDSINATGNGLANKLTGNSGANVLNGMGGADNMRGLGGSDIYHVDNAGDQISEAVGGGYDRVAASVSYTLAAGQEIEVFTTNNSASASAIDLTGNEFANSIVGNAGVNRLDGRGGADTMQGIGGNDIYLVDNTGDRAIEAVDGGYDRVATGVSYALAAVQEIELFTTNNAGSTSAIDLTGNEFVNYIIGNAGANRIDGKVGADTMQGVGGNDIYLVDNAGDLVLEAVGGGNDRVATGVSYVLTAGQEIELFTTTNTASAVAINLTGNAHNQTIIGNAGNNILNGNAGNDTLTGLGGNDTFVFNTALNPATNVDTITDFSVVNDAIALENAVFAGLAAGALSANAFRIGAAAGDADDRIIYNNLTGQLIFDSNGNATGGATQFAKLAAGLALTSADFLVI